MQAPPDFARDALRIEQKLLYLDNLLEKVFNLKLNKFNIKKSLSCTFGENKRFKRVDFKEKQVFNPKFSIKKRLEARAGISWISPGHCNTKNFESTALKQSSKLVNNSDTVHSYFFYSNRPRYVR